MSDIVLVTRVSFLRTGMVYCSESKSSPAEAENLKVRKSASLFMATLKYAGALCPLFISLIVMAARWK